MGKENCETDGALIPMVGKVVKVRDQQICVEYANRYYKGENVLAYAYLPIEGQEIPYKNSKGCVRWRPAKKEELREVQEGEDILLNLRGSWTFKK